MEMLKQLVVSEMMAQLTDYLGVPIQELPYAFYNEDYYIIGYREAEAFAKEHFDAMLQALAWHQDQFGTGYPDTDDIEKVVSLMMLVACEKVLCESEVACQYGECPLDMELVDFLLSELASKYDIGDAA